MIKTYILSASLLSGSLSQAALIQWADITDVNNATVATGAVTITNTVNSGGYASGRPTVLSTTPIDTSSGTYTWASASTDAFFVDTTNVIGSSVTSTFMSSFSTPVTVWVENIGSHTTALMEYTSDNGATWQLMNAGSGWDVTASAGMFYSSSTAVSSFNDTTAEITASSNSRGVLLVGPNSAIDGFRITSTRGIAAGGDDHFISFGTVVPEPSSTALLGLSGISLLLRRRR